TEGVAASEDVVVVECNATGQFADVLEHDVLERVKRVNKYTGVRYKAEELAAEVEAAIAGDAGADTQEVEAE
ncbi:MAG: 2-oxoacid:acceptor oxidoreductase subunit alpha, partial [Haloarculaceae archaeon]